MHELSRFCLFQIQNTDDSLKKPFAILLHYLNLCANCMILEDYCNVFSYAMVAYMYNMYISVKTVNGFIFV